MLTDSDIAAMAELARTAKERAERTTPGPWIEGQKKLRNKPPIDSCPGYRTGIAMTAPGQGVFANPPGGSYPHFDGQFIAAARTDVPALADAVLALIQAMPKLEWREDDYGCRRLHVGTFLVGWCNKDGDAWIDCWGDAYDTEGEAKTAVETEVKKAWNNGTKIR